MRRQQRGAENARGAGSRRHGNGRNPGIRPVDCLLWAPGPLLLQRIFLSSIRILDLDAWMAGRPSGRSTESQPDPGISL